MSGVQTYRPDFVIGSAVGSAQKMINYCALSQIRKLFCDFISRPQVSCIHMQNMQCMPQAVFPVDASEHLNRPDLGAPMLIIILGSKSHE